MQHLQAPRVGVRPCPNQDREEPGPRRSIKLHPRRALSEGQRSGVAPQHELGEKGNHQQLEKARQCGDSKEWKRRQQGGKLPPYLISQLHIEVDGADGPEATSR